MKYSTPTKSKEKAIFIVAKLRNVLVNLGDLIIFNQLHCAVSVSTESAELFSSWKRRPHHWLSKETGTLQYHEVWGAFLYSTEDLFTAHRGLVFSCNLFRISSGLICCLSDCTVGRPQAQAEIRTRDGRSRSSLSVSSPFLPSQYSYLSPSSFLRSPSLV